jgi:hypothetical protein
MWSTLNIFGGVPQVGGVGDFLTCAKGSYNKKHYIVVKV